MVEDISDRMLFGALASISRNCFRINRGEEGEERLDHVQR